MSDGPSQRSGHELWRDWAEDRIVDPRLAATIAAAVAASQRSASRATDVGDLLTEHGRAFDVDGLHGVHMLRRRVGGFDYRARVDVDGVLPRLLIARRLTALSSEDRETFGPQALLRRTDLPSFVAHTRAPDVLRAFETDALAAALQGHSARIALRPDTDRRTVVEVDVFVGDGRVCNPALHIVELVARTARAMADSGLVFAERTRDAGPAAERVEALLARVTSAVSWVSGPVARVGDGVEARLALDEQPDAPSVLRFALDDADQCSVFFEGRLLERTEVTTRLRPQDGLLDKLRGLLDTKVDGAAFDEAWLIDGDAAVGKLLATHASLLLRLRERHATIEVGPPGLVVRVPAFVDDDAALVEVAGSILSLWRELCRSARGFGHA